MATKKATTRKSTTRKTATKKAATTKKATAKKATAKNAVGFVDDIPKVTREYNGSRSSKYDDLLNKLVDRANENKKSTARMVFESVGQSTSRYQSIKTAIERREDDAFMFTVAQRTENEDRVVYVKFDPKAEDPEDEEPAEEVEEEEVEEDEDVLLDDDEDDEEDEDEEDFDF